MAVTAKVTVQRAEPVGEDEVQLHFVPDYADGRNRDWAKYTPGLSLVMTVKGEVGEQFRAGDAYTLTFEREEAVAAGLNG